MLQRRTTKGNEVDLVVTRTAACNCGQLSLACAGEPVRVSMCHCLECQRRTGAVFGNQAWFERSQMTSISGDSTTFTRLSDPGRSVKFRFCPVCGSTVYWEAEGFPGLIAVAVGSFADPDFSPPKHSVWERRRHHWVETIADVFMQHSY
jgi:hypothetical protein